MTDEVMRTRYVDADALLPSAQNVLRILSGDITPVRRDTVIEGVFAMTDDAKFPKPGDPEPTPPTEPTEEPLESEDDPQTSPATPEE